MRRTNHETFEKVEKVIELADKGLFNEAAAYCKSIGIPIDVAYRVILTPEHRRKLKSERRINKE